MRQTLSASLLLCAGLSALWAQPGFAPNTAMPGELHRLPPNAPDQRPAFAGQTRAPEQRSNVAFQLQTVATGLVNPWSLAFLPDGRMLVTERPGRLRIVAADGTLSPAVAGLPPVAARGQGGLLEIATDPAFARNRLIYWSYAEPAPGGGGNATAVARGRLVDGPAPRVEGVQVVFRQRPALDSALHFGGRLVFARDGTLFVTTGERSVIPGRMQAQQLDSLLGKVVRINPDGTIPKNNPMVRRAGAAPEIWSYGHRNVQAAAINPATGRLWTIEHGTRGGDEINIPQAGKDYGWPTIAYGIEYNGQKITGGETRRPGMEQPIYYWDPVIGPSGMTFYTGAMFPAWRGSLFVGGLRANSLVRLTLKRDRVVGEERLLIDQKARIRDVRQGPDGALYVLTDAPEGKLLRLTRG